MLLSDKPGDVGIDRVGGNTAPVADADGLDLTGLDQGEHRRPANAKSFGGLFDGEHAPECGLLSRAESGHLRAFLGVSPAG